MNYAKVIGSAMQLFPKKIKVTLIDAATGNSLGMHKVPAELLPVAFNRPTRLEINNINWRVLKADPILADDFLFKKKLTLHVRKENFSDDAQGLFSLPTLCYEQPVTDGDSLHNNFTLVIAKNEWRQVEFLPLQQWEVIQEEIKVVENILGDQPNPLLGYTQQYKRAKTASTTLEISWEIFYSLLLNSEAGSLCLDDNSFVQQGFALRSDNYMYYGVLLEGNIQTLSITQFNSVDDELMLVLDTFKLVLIDWCNASIISAELGEEPKSEFINI
jgi:hypothetical protein